MDAGIQGAQAAGCAKAPGEARFPGLARRWQAELARLARSGRGVFLFLASAACADLASEVAGEASLCDLAEAAGAGAAGILMPDMEPLEAERRALALHARLTALAGCPVTAAYGLVRREPESMACGASARGASLDGFFASVLKALDEGPQDGRLHRVREPGAELGARVLAEEKRFLLFGSK